MKVFVANFGRENFEWPVCLMQRVWQLTTLANSTFWRFFGIKGMVLPDV